MTQPAVAHDPDPLAEAARLWGERVGDATVMEAVTGVMRLQQLMQAAIDAVLRPTGLTFARYEALVLLSFSRSGSLPMGLVGKRLMIHPTSVTNVVDRLERDRLVARLPHPSDRRTTLVRLLPAGRERAEEATRALQDSGFGMGEGLAAAARGELDALVAGVRGLRARLGDPPSPADVPPA